MKHIEAMKLALEALEICSVRQEHQWHGLQKMQMAKHALREALAQERSSDEQPAPVAEPRKLEPVAYAVYHRMGGGKSLHWPEQHSPNGDANEYQLVPLYTSPSNQPGYQAMAMAVTRLQKRCLELEGKQPAQQEPVAWRAWFDADNGARWLFTLWPEEERLDVKWEPLYIAAQRQWVGLTNDEREEVMQVSGKVMGKPLARAIEAKLKEKNT